MRQTQLLFLVLAAAGCAMGQDLQMASPQGAPSQNATPQATPPSGYFQHLPSMPVSPKLFQAPTKFHVTNPPAVTVEAQPASCAIPLIEAQPSAKIEYPIQTVTPPPAENSASAYVPTVPTCRQSGQTPAVAKKFNGGLRK